MKFTDLFIRRPLLAWVINALILLFGIVAFSNLGLRPYPKVENATVNINTAYPGASADVVQGFITGLIQRAVIGAEGIDYYTSTSRDGTSSITIYVANDYNVDLLLTDVIAKVASVKGELPPNSLEPVITKMANTAPPVWFQVIDDNMSPEQITEFFYRVIRPQVLTVEGVAGLILLGERPFAMRIWLDPIKMVAMNVTAADLMSAVQRNNFLAEAGEIRDTIILQPVRAATDINNAQDFSNIVIRESNGTLVRVRDVATVELASAPERKKGYVNGVPSLLIGVDMAPDSNPLALSKKIKAELKDLHRKLPSTMSTEVFFDLGVFVDKALREVTQTLFEALAIVALITLLFFGNPRSVLIMLISIPLSIVGTFLIMWLLGYTLNLFTLLALVIAIGLVVDDTIVVVENIHRHIEHGEAPMQAAILGAREVIGPVTAMSLTLVAVFLPVGFMQGLSGQLIREFVFTLAGAVAISGITALTLSPMLSSRILKPDSEASIALWLDNKFDQLKQRYANILTRNMHYRPVWLMAMIVIIGSIPFLFLLSEKELVPTEDSGYIHVAFSTPKHLSEEYNSRIGAEVEKTFVGIPGSSGETLRLQGMLGDGTTLAVAEMLPWDERSVSTMDLISSVQTEVSKIAGVQANAFVVDLSPASGSGQLPIQMVIQSTDDYRFLADNSDLLLNKIRASGNFIFSASDLQFSQPELQIKIDRDKAGELGVTMADIATTLSILLGEGYINRFSYEGESYKVIPQANPDQRFERYWLNNYYVPTASGESIPLSALIETEFASKPPGLNQFDGLNAATISLALMPGVSLSSALDFLNQAAAEVLPHGYSVDYVGKARSFLQEGNVMLYTFMLAILTIYLFLVAQYESLRDPLVILVTVPMSLCGALLFLCIDIASLSLFSQVGLITLVGLISKHGILMVDFARRQQELGADVQTAIIEAAAVRLRPILMTTAAIVVAVIPLLTANGPGAISRNHIGVVLISGMLVGTLFTLFILPVIYSFLAERRTPINESTVIEDK